jgi:hypothetical protein
MMVRGSDPLSQPAGLTRHNSPITPVFRIRHPDGDCEPDSARALGLESSASPIFIIRETRMTGMLTLLILAGYVALRACHVHDLAERPRAA